MKKGNIVEVKINADDRVYVKEMLASDRRAVKHYAKNGKGIDEDKYEIGLVGVSLCNAEGLPLFSPDTYDQIESSYTVREYDRILSAIAEINFLEETAEEIAGKL